MRFCRLRATLRIGWQAPGGILGPGYRVSGSQSMGQLSFRGQGVGLQVPIWPRSGLEGPKGSCGRPTKSLGSRDRPIGSQGVKGWAYRFPGGKGAGLQALWVPGGQRMGLQAPRGQGLGLQGPRGSRGRPTGSQEVQG